MPDPLATTWRMRSSGSRSPRNWRTASRMLSCSGPRVRSMRRPSARETEEPVADDVALDVLGAAADRLREAGEIAVRPAVDDGPLARRERRSADDLHGEHVDALHELGEEKPDDGRLGTRHTGPGGEA